MQLRIEDYEMKKKENKHHSVELKDEESIPTLVGLKEFAEIIGWDKRRLSVKLKRQQQGMKVRPPLPEPIQILAATPVWTKQQALSYKKILDKNK